MLNVFLLLGIAAVATRGAPLYGDDGGYQGYASYSPSKGVRSLGRRTGPTASARPSGDVDLSENTNYATRIRGSEQPRAPVAQKSQAPRPSHAYDVVPKNYDVLQYSPRHSHGYGSNQILSEGKSTPYSHATVYGPSNGGYKMADVYPQTYSGSSASNQYDHQDYPHQPQPYEYGFQLKDEHGNEQFKQESGDGHGSVKGSYGFTDEHGLYRRVEYVADKEGFRANVKTNEPGTDNQDPADVHVESEQGHAKY